jgi:16S rRNA (guanine966-N2)-methyltransferase
VTRIIAGSVGGRRLRTPPGEAVRPTTDRVREALFSTLESAFGSWAGICFLDLFAGSGAVGLEAVSRGAAHATLVEQRPRAAATARGNARALGLASVDVVVSRAEAFVRAGTGAPGVAGCCDCYHVAFLDPPYTMPGHDVTALLAALVEHRRLCREATVVVERSVRDEDLAWPRGLSADRARRYGETVVWYGRAT